MLLWMLACTGEIGSAPTDQSPDSGVEDSKLPDTGTPDTDADLRELGPYAVNSETLTLSVSCEAPATRYWPSGAGDAPTVLLAHGFARSQANMVEIAEHLASWGLEVYTPDLCEFSNHQVNGDDLALAASQLSRPVVYMGYSAGGLASVLAGAQDSSAKGVVGLDPVDNDSLGASAALSVPARGLFGEPGACNAESSGLGMFAERMIVVDGDHCDFEGPTDGICEAFCDGATSSDDPERRAMIRGMATAAALGMHGDPELLTAWWTAEGAWGSQLVSAGALRTEP